MPTYLTLWLKLAAMSFSAWDGGLKSGLLATVLSVIACKYLFLSTIYFQKQISPAIITLLLIFSLVSLLISGLNEQLKVARKSSVKSLVKAEEARAERDQIWQQERAARESAEAANRVKDQSLAVLYHAMIKAVELHNQLQSSEERLQLSLQAAQMGTWDWNLLSNHITWSSNMEALFGLASDMLKATSLLSLFPSQSVRTNLGQPHFNFPKKNHHELVRDCQTKWLK